MPVYRIYRRLSIEFYLYGQYHRTTASLGFRLPATHQSDQHLFVHTDMNTWVKTSTRITRSGCYPAEVSNNQDLSMLISLIQRLVCCVKSVIVLDWARFRSVMFLEEPGLLEMCEPLLCWSFTSSWKVEFLVCSSCLGFVLCLWLQWSFCGFTCEGAPETNWISVVRLWFCVGLLRFCNAEGTLEENFQMNFSLKTMALHLRFHYFHHTSLFKEPLRALFSRTTTAARRGPAEPAPAGITSGPGEWSVFLEVQLCMCC